MIKNSTVYKIAKCIFVILKKLFKQNVLSKLYVAILTITLFH
jgi:hypothetical protein